MSEVTERSVVSAENYTEIKNMMLANDEASKTMALTILEQSDFEKSEVFILCMVKETFEDLFGKHGPFKDFEDGYPVLHKNITDALTAENTSIAQLSFRQIYQLAVRRNLKEEITFMLNIFKEELLQLLGDYGFTFLEYLDIEIKPKPVPSA